jgi:hypothetical protein
MTRNMRQRTEEKETKDNYCCYSGVTKWLVNHKLRAQLYDDCDIIPIRPLFLTNAIGQEKDS